MKRGDLARIPGGQVDEVGKNLLDDILTHSQTKTDDVTGGNFKGGLRFIRPDGGGAVFDADGTFQYFGVKLRYPG